MPHRLSPFVRYLAPLAAWLAFPIPEPSVTEPYAIWAFYGMRTLVVLGVFVIAFRDHWGEIEGHFDLKAVELGVIVAISWVAIVQMSDSPPSGDFDPSLLEFPALELTAVALKLLGTCLVAPVLEEVVFRSFLPRFLINDDFLSVPLGTYSHLSFWGAVAAFTLVHQQHEWVAAAIAGMAYGLYVLRTRNLVGSIVAHATTNACVALYTLMTQQWNVWG
jgi:CAAX prenyl protease-like protein